jgi:hypothetical protein
VKNPRQDSSKSGKKPRMVRLVVVCLLVWVVCGALTWFAEQHLGDCCDVSSFSNLFK